jgi:uridine kinase
MYFISLYFAYKHLFFFFSNFNFDHPDAFDFDLLLYTLKNMKEGLEIYYY